MPTAYQGSAAEVAALNAFIVLSRATEALQRAAWELAPLPEGITATQFGVMEALYHRGSLCQSELARKILKSKGNITMVVHNLERRELVNRRVNPADARELRVDLTPAGRDLMAGYFPRLAAAFARVCSGVEPDQLRVAIAIVRELGLSAAFVAAGGALSAGSV